MPDADAAQVAQAHAASAAQPAHHPDHPGYFWLHLRFAAGSVFRRDADGKTRGNDFGNVLGMVAGFVAVAILSGLPNDLAAMFGTQLYAQPSWLPVIEFPWRVMFGTVVTFAVAVSFPVRAAGICPAAVRWGLSAPGCQRRDKSRKNC